MAAGFNFAESRSRITTSFVRLFYGLLGAPTSPASVALEQPTPALRRRHTLLYTDGSAAFLRIEKELGMPVKSVATSWHGPVLNDIHLAHPVNSCHERLKS